MALAMEEGSRLPSVRQDQSAVHSLRRSRARHLAFGVHPTAPDLSVGAGPVVTPSRERHRPVCSTLQRGDERELSVPTGSAAALIATPGLSSTISSRAPRTTSLFRKAIDCTGADRFSVLSPSTKGLDGAGLTPAHRDPALSCQEPMVGAPDRVHADDVTLGIDTQGRGGWGARNVNAGEAAVLVEQEPMRGPPGKSPRPRCHPEG